jgi:hypothetical protein
MTMKAIALAVVVLLAAPDIVDGFVLIPSHDLLKFTPRRAAPIIVKVPPIHSMKSSIVAIRTHLPLTRPHERVIFSFCSCVGASFMVLWARKILNQVQVESFISILWIGMITGISFLEAWVKFKAPFLRKHVAVDVGRHVFCALNAAELALAASFWIGRVVLAPPVRNAFVLPALATALLLGQVLLIAPKLYIRAKYKIVNAASDEQLLDEEQSVLTSLQDEIRDKPLPPAKWHFVYVLLESMKVTCLTGFVFTMWTRSI